MAAARKGAAAEKSHAFFAAKLNKHKSIFALLFSIMQIFASVI